MATIWEKGKPTPTLKEAMSMDEKEFRKKAGITERDPELPTTREDRVHSLVKGLGPEAEDLIRTIHKARR